MRGLTVEHLVLVQQALDAASPVERSKWETLLLGLTADFAAEQMQAVSDRLVAGTREDAADLVDRLLQCGATFAGMTGTLSPAEITAAVASAGAVLDRLRLGELPPEQVSLFDQVFQHAQEESRPEFRRPLSKLERHLRLVSGLPHVPLMDWNSPEEPH